MEEPKIVEREGRKIPSVNGKTLEVAEGHVIQNCCDLVSISDSEVCGRLTFLYKGGLLPFVWNHTSGFVKILKTIENEEIECCTYVSYKGKSVFSGHARVKGVWLLFDWNFATGQVDTRPDTM